MENLSVKTVAKYVRPEQEQKHVHVPSKNVIPTKWRTNYPHGQLSRGVTQGPPIRGIIKCVDCQAVIFKVNFVSGERRNVANRR